MCLKHTHRYTERKEVESGKDKRLISQESYWVVLRTLTSKLWIYEVAWFNVKNLSELGWFRDHKLPDPV